MADRKALRLAATSLFAGVAISFVAGIFHPDREPANDHPAVFAEYAASSIWTLVHLGQFVGMTGLVSGLIGLFFALNVQEGRVGWIGKFGVVSSVVALALYGVLQAVDGVALKQAVNAWASAPDGERAVRFASAETIRWLEWGVRSYQSFTLGLSFLLFATVIVLAASIPKAIGYLMGCAGMAYLVQSWIIGSEGFSGHNVLPTLFGIILVLVTSIWIMWAAWRMPDAEAADRG
ncbi:MAG: hypothetical protein E5W91_31665 [Mesorhizobium sp.]|uniref:hypothetical protein n=1 Tax=Mesorhizobium sp. TaxID=1871066 RepID=UPI0011FD4E7B|nr:hypothetical protein [Mesorhizobium sp.]TIS53298.1 MAG: hypothetical protein E5W91_31665 [Mesorhizobium sp.]